PSSSAVRMSAPPRAPSGAAARAAPPTLSRRERAALHARGLTMMFGGVRAVHRLDLDAPPGAVTSVIGPNGAGKSTALSMLSGFYRPSAGTIALGVNDIGRRRAYRIARSGVARTYQTAQLFGSLTVEENVSLAMYRGALGHVLDDRRLRATDVRTRSRALLAYCGYAGDCDARASDLPHVDRRLVEIARALATDPDVLLLDEPAAGLSREDKARLADLLKRVAEAGIGVVLVEHDMRLVMSVSDRVIVLDAGQLLAAGTPAEVQQSDAVRQAYLGESLNANIIGGARRPARADGEALGASGLSAGYGAEPVLNDVSLQLRRGETLALLGANGAGKSTLMRALAGLHRPVGGGITLEGVDITDLAAERIVAHGLVLVPEGRQVFPELTVLDNIRLGAFRHPDNITRRVEQVLDRFPPLRRRLAQRAGLLSGGEQQMLAIARGLMSQPKVLLLDEPSLGLAPKVIAELFDALDRLRNESMTLLLVDQMAGLALALADRACVMENGAVVAHGPAKDIAAHPALAQAYLGA
ncbi:MAG: ATP-binding cassette domain-containing protein, partial [Rhodospirillaceae bacterium]